MRLVYGIAPTPALKMGTFLSPGLCRRGRRYTSPPMRRRSIHRCLTSAFVVVSLLFSQVASARDLCPGAMAVAAMAEMTTSAINGNKNAFV